MRNSEVIKTLDGSEIAIIGLAGRFPGARNVDEFWQNLQNGVESVTFLTAEEIEQSSIDSASIDAPNYVKAAALLDGVELFDASFFGYTPREAEIMDPQHRLFLECAWEALEDAGYDAESYQGSIGVFAGARTNSYLFNLASNRDALSTVGIFEIGLGNDFAFLSSRVSYKLNLKGPSYSVHTACSTSLVAVHLACQSLLIDECQMALAGGVAVNVPQKSGYLHFQGSYASPDGHTRTFDEKAQGTIFGSGVGVVVLKRLADALADGDSVYAVIRGSAINNDGAFKANYLAPSVQGQAEAISVAIACAGVKADSISYVEAHGTGTALGDPIEIRALTKAFRSTTDKKGFCAIGSVKSNIGHLDAAAGVASLIKTALALKHKLIPPSINFHRPNPKIDFANSPFFVADKLSAWPRSSTPRRAGVSSFGVGGANAHLILEEAPEVERSSASRPWLPLPISAKTDSALQAATDNLAAYLKSNPEVNLGDVAYTLSLGRKAFGRRRVVICGGLEDAVRALKGDAPERVLTGLHQSDDRPVFFMFPGGGSQYVNMARGLFLNEPFFRQQLLSCFEVLRPLIPFDLSSILFPSDPASDRHSQLLSSTSAALPAIFCIEYSLANLWMHWGIRPRALIGHSLGEYVAACLAGVFSLEDALSLVVARGRLFEQLPAGAMLSAPLSEAELRPMLNDGLSIAASNGPNLSVVSGPRQAVEQMAEKLKNLAIDYRMLHINAAGHSEMVEPILGSFAQYTKKLKLSPPSIPYISNLTGAWITEEQATDPSYWVEHLRRTVRFGDGIQELMKEPNSIFLEVGPGQTLSTIVKLQQENRYDHTVISSIRHPSDQVSDEMFLMIALGKLWLTGATVSWDKVYENEQRQRIALPPYPFQRQRYWIDPKPRSEKAGDLLAISGKRTDISEWFYIPSWKLTTPPQPIAGGPKMPEGGKWLIFSDGQEIADSLITSLKEKGQEVIVVKRAGQDRQGDAETRLINERSVDDYRRLIKELARAQGLPDQILHLWSLTGDREPALAEELFESAQYAGCYSLLFLAQALIEEDAEREISLWVVADGLQAIERSDRLRPEKATILGPSKVIPQEARNIRIKCIDVVIPAHNHERNELVNQLLLETTRDKSEGLIAFRGRKRWEQIYEPAPLAPGGPQVRELRDKGVYLILGGLGGVGLLLAKYLAEQVGARLVLTSRTELPPRSEWDRWLEERGEEDADSKKIRKIQEIEDLGAEVVTAATDVTDLRQLQALIQLTLDRFGQLNGVLYAAGTTSGPSLFRPMTELGPEEFEMQFSPKGRGLYVLEEALRGQPIDFCLLFSSNSSVLGGLGFAAYSAANCFVDAFAIHCSQSTGAPWISASWDGWPEETKKITGLQTSMDQYSMTAEESAEAFRRLVCLGPEGHVVVATGDLPARLDLWIKLKSGRRAESMNGTSLSPSHPRPNLQSAYIAPRNEQERIVANTWQELLGIDQVGIHDNFFDLGGHSLLATRLVAQLREIFEVEIPLRRLFETPTVQGLAQAIADIKAGEGDNEKREILDLLAQLSEEEADREVQKRTQIAATIDES